MRSFREYCESEAPATVNNNVGKPDGGKVSKKGEIDYVARLERMKKRKSGTKTESDLPPIEQIYKGLGDRLAAIDQQAQERREAGEKTLFQQLFQSASDEMRDILDK